MLTIEESQVLMERLVDLRKKYAETGDIQDKLAIKKQENLCVEKFAYLVMMKTSKYKSFSNYDDLNQEGMEALLKAMNNYNPKKGCWFWWAHKYIDTRISRTANLHTTIRFPLKVAKEQTPHKDAIMPLLIEEFRCPDKELERAQAIHIVQSAVSHLTQEQREIVSLAFGFEGKKPMSINKICKQYGISRLNCIKIIKGAMANMKEKIRI
jgi:RNA polymerase sigma factor (sigma-70 family)